MKQFHLIFILSCCIFGCNESGTTSNDQTMEGLSQDEKTLSYLALGDSYTIGEAVDISERWPVQLVERLKANEISIEDPRIIATTGWTTAELQAGIQSSGIEQTYDMVSLLIGVNNQYRGYDIEIYRKEFRELLDSAITYAGGTNENVFVVSIPDYGVTPFAINRGLNSETIARELDAYNEMAESICNELGVAFFEITKWSRNAANDESLIASDGLHPSGKMYTNWVDTCYDWVYNNLATR